MVGFIVEGCCEILIGLEKDFVVACLWRLYCLLAVLVLDIVLAWGGVEDVY